MDLDLANLVSQNIFQINFMTFQEEAIREIGKEICNTVKYWKPVSSQMTKCVVCGLSFYHIIEHSKKHLENEFSNTLDKNTIV